MSESEELLRVAREVAVTQSRDGGKLDVTAMMEQVEPVLARLGCREAQRLDRPRILIVRDDAAGDFVLFSPFLREVRRLYPQAEIVMVVSPRNAGLARACPYVDTNLEVRFSYDPDRIWEGWQQVATFAAQELLHYRFDLAFCPRLGVCSMSLLMAYLSGAKERVGFSQDRLTPAGTLARTGWDVLLTRPVPFPMRELHDVDRDLLLLEDMLRLPVADWHLEVWYTPEEAQEAARRTEALAAAHPRLFAVAPGASTAMKCWPAERYAEVLAAIAAEEPEVGVVLLGGPGDRGAAETVAAALGERALVLAGEVPFSVSAAVVARCALYLGNDTGLMHVAAALHLPVLSVNCFPVSLGLQVLSLPVRFRPYGVPSVTCVPREARDGCADAWRYGCSREGEAHCILGVTVRQVLDAYQLLRRKVAAGDARSVLFRT